MERTECVYSEQSVDPQVSRTEKCSHGTQDSENDSQVVDVFVATSAVVLSAKLT